MEQYAPQQILKLKIVRAHLEVYDTRRGHGLRPPAQLLRPALQGLHAGKGMFRLILECYNYDMIMNRKKI